MKRLALVLILFCVTILGALPQEKGDDSKALSVETHTAGNLNLDVGNYGFCGDLIYPVTTGDKLLCQGGIWIGGKLRRRDDEGRLLFWLAQNPSADSSAITYEGAPDWHPWLKPVVDTLCSASIDGYFDVYELLPAHNPLACNNPYYFAYNSRDKVLKSILGYPAPREFEWPDTSGNYCFTDPQPEPSDSPGFETLTSFFYDFCPFGTPGDRDLGASHSMNHHYPLGIAIERSSHAWNLQNHDKMVVFEVTVYNTSEQDTIFDLALAEYVDSDIYPIGQESDGMDEDISGYVPGDEFAYTRDANGDNGLSQNYLAHKLILPGISGKRSCWSWRMTFGPGDLDARSLNYLPFRTANEKYWLMTGRNPREYACYSLRPDDASEQIEEPVWGDTRFLNTIYGSQPSVADPDPEGRLCLAPGASITYYSVYFIADSIDALKVRSQTIEDFIAGNMEIETTSGLTSIPYILGFDVTGDEVARVSWHSYTDPDHFEVMFKRFNAPASQWQRVTLPGDRRECHLWYWMLGLGNCDYRDYELKVAAIYNPGANETYLESETILVNIHESQGGNYQTPPTVTDLDCYPNPFRNYAMARFAVNQAGPVRLAVYNIRGQKVRDLADMTVEPGTYSVLWNGRDDNGSNCGSGIYIMRLECGGTSLVKRIVYQGPQIYGGI
jgi:hypothetical protein